MALTPPVSGLMLRWEDCPESLARSLRAIRTGNIGRAADPFPSLDLASIEIARGHVS